MVIHLANDLMLVGKLSSWAKRESISYRNISSLAAWDSEIAGENESPQPSWVLVDLQLAGLAPQTLAESVRQRWPHSKILGYAQHVKTDLLQAGQSAGFDQVVTRGQFDRSFAQLVTS